MKKRNTLMMAILVVCGMTATALAGGPPKINMLETERLLDNLGYWITKVDGVADSSTRQAIIAYQKVEGLKRTGALRPADIGALRAAARPQPRYTTGADHIEIDLSRQILFFVDASGTVARILPVSSGNEKRYFDEGQWQIAHTPRGRFHVTHKINGVRKASLGILYYPSYFYGGVAIHGSNSVPAFPASHGCVRIPRFADRAFQKMVKIGMEVIVYD